MAPPGRSQIQLPHPGPALKAVLLGLLSIWLVFALAMNWAGVSQQTFVLLSAQTSEILAGEIWRLITAPLLHAPNSIGHIISALLGLYFLGSSLEQKWGSKRFLSFLAWSAGLSYAVQTGLSVVFPATLSAKLMPPVQFGALPAVEAVAIAWACSFRGQTVHLFFVLPISSRGLVLFVVGFSTLALIAGQTPPSGHLALFAGMGFGWLLGGNTPSPLRRMVLQWKLARLDREVEEERNRRQKRVARSGLRVIDGQGEKGDDKKMLH